MLCNRIFSCVAALLLFFGAAPLAAQELAPLCQKTLNKLDKLETKTLRKLNKIPAKVEKKIEKTRKKEKKVAAPLEQNLDQAANDPAGFEADHAKAIQKAAKNDKNAERTLQRAAKKEEKGVAKGNAKFMKIVNKAEAKLDGCPLPAAGPFVVERFRIPPYSCDFLPGDWDQNGSLNITDIVRAGSCFARGEHCMADGAWHIADFDQDGATLLNDFMNLVRYLFAGGNPPAAPCANYSIILQ